MCLTRILYIESRSTNRIKLRRVLCNLIRLPKFATSRLKLTLQMCFIVRDMGWILSRRPRVPFIPARVCLHWNRSTSLQRTSPSVFSTSSNAPVFPAPPMKKSVHLSWITQLICKRGLFSHFKILPRLLIIMSKNIWDQ